MTRHECNGRVVPLRAAPACRYAATGRHRFGVLTAVRRAWQRWPNLCCHRNTLAFLYEPLIDVGERSGQLRPYVRPVARHLPLAIMGVRMRVRHQSVGRAQGTRLLPVLPELFLTTAFPITRFSVSCRISRAYARRPPPCARTSRRRFRCGRNTSFRPVDLFTRHQRPCDARHLVRQSDRYQPDRAALQNPSASTSRRRYSIVGLGKPSTWHRGQATCGSPGCRFW